MDYFVMILQVQLSQIGRYGITVNRLSDLAGKVLLQSPVMLRNRRLFGTSTFTVRSDPLRLFLLLIPALPFSFPHMYSVFVIRHADKYCCAQALCYDIFIVCVHVEDVDLNTAFYHALNAALANQSSRFQRFI